MVCSGSEAGSYLRLIDFVYHSTLGLRIIKKVVTTPDSIGDTEKSMIDDKDKSIIDISAQIT